MYREIVRGNDERDTTLLYHTRACKGEKGKSKKMPVREKLLYEDLPAQPIYLNLGQYLLFSDYRVQNEMFENSMHSRLVISKGSPM